MTSAPREAGWVKSLRARYRDVDFSGVGIADADIMIDNIFTIGVKAHEARSQGFYVEAIDLTAHLCEFLLLIWLARRGHHKLARGRPTLGNWITEADEEGFDADLIRRLRAFNAKRGQAVHRLLRGELRYADLSKVLENDEKLVLHVAKAALEGRQLGFAARIAANLAASSAATRPSQ